MKMLPIILVSVKYRYLNIEYIIRNVQLLFYLNNLYYLLNNYQLMGQAPILYYCVHIHGVVDFSTNLIFFSIIYLWNAKKFFYNFEHVEW